jgi:hypothetical protein
MSDGGSKNDSDKGRRHPDRGPREQDRGRGGSRGGAEFLDLELSKVLFGEASELTRVAARELLTEAIKARLRERMGDRLDAVARLAADELIDDMEANLEIERRISSRQRARGNLDERLADLFATPKPAEATRARRRR